MALAELSPDLAHGTVTGARLRGRAGRGRSRQGVLKVEITETGQVVEAEVTIRPGLQPVEAQIAVDHPALWWPVGHGEQPLYTV